DGANDRRPQAGRGRGCMACRARRPDTHRGAPGVSRTRLAGLALIAGVARALAADPPSPLGPCRPIERPYDPVEMPGAALHRLGGPPIPRLGLIAFRSGSATPIPFQLDERRGRKLALDHGPEPTDDDKPGVVDADDVLVFMPCDAGEQASPALVAEALRDAGGGVWREIRIEDPVDHRTAFVYLVAA